MHMLAHHPIHLYLLQEVAFVKITYNVTVTPGHVPGAINVYSDAASRDFQLANGHGPYLREEISLLHRLPWPKDLMADIS